LKSVGEIQHFERDKLIDYHRDMYMARDAMLKTYQRSAPRFKSVIFVTNCPDLDGERGIEPLVALQQNLLNPFIEKVILFNHHPKNHLTGHFFINSEKIEMVQLTTRFSIGHAMTYCNTKFPGKIVLIGNMDIYFDTTLSNLLDMKDREFYTLSRQRTLEGDNIMINLRKQETIFNNMCIEYMSAHDVFGGVTPFPAMVIRESNDARLGDRGIDNLLNYLFWRSGWILRNPCSSVLVHHLHSRRSTHKDTKKKVWSGYDIFVYPEDHKYLKETERQWLERYMKVPWYPAQSKFMKERQALVLNSVESRRN
jgi:hypothetical protein